MIGNQRTISILSGLADRPDNSEVAAQVNNGKTLVGADHAATRSI